MMPFTFTFTDKQLSIIEEGLSKMVAGNDTSPFAYHDVVQLQDEIERRLEW